MSEIKIDLGKLKVKDLELINKAMEVGAQGRFPPELIELLDRVVEGGVRERPLTELGDILAAFTKAMEDVFRPLAE